MDPASLALMVSATSGVASGIAGMQAAEGEAERARINSYIARTRSMQTDTTSREGLEDELASMRAALGGGQQRPGVGTMEIVSELRRIRNRERRIDVGNHRSEAADWRLRGRNARAEGRAALIGGIARAGPSMFDLYQLHR